MTANLPFFNRNQGNIDRAQKNARQTRIELSALERQVIYDVQDAISEFNASRLTVEKYKHFILPKQAQVLASAKRRLRRADVDFLFYLSARKDYFDVFRQYRDALVRHRRAQLDLNTAVGAAFFLETWNGMFILLERDGRVMGHRRRHAKRIKAERVPAFEGLERREVLSVTPMLAQEGLRAQASKREHSMPS